MTNTESNLPTKLFCSDDWTHEHWAGLTWSEWVPFEGGNTRLWSCEPGLYWVRVQGTQQLAYIGQTGRDLRARLQALRRGALDAKMPWNDPHTAAPGLWAWKDAAGFAFEASAAPLEASREQRLAIECMLLWRYRQAAGRTTLCNLGHFHGDYSRPGNRGTGRCGARLESQPGRAATQDSLAGLPSRGAPCSDDWMGLAWTPFVPVSRLVRRPGLFLYRLRVAGTGEVCYIGQSQGLGGRMRSHARTFAPLALEVSHLAEPLAGGLVHALELENDLIGGFFATQGSAPRFQFQGGAVEVHGAETSLQQPGVSARGPR